LLECARENAMKDLAAAGFGESEACIVSCFWVRMRWV
jgi:hypothetical protein